jgi:hypothetical protein
MGKCPCAPTEDGKRECYVSNTRNGSNNRNDDDNNNTRQQSTTQLIKCQSECQGRQLFCLARTRFHVGLAQLGKTTLSEKERRLLASKDIDGGTNLVNLNITNSIMLYEQTQLNDDDFWIYLANFLKISHVPNKHYQGSSGKQQLTNNICLPKYDYFRSLVMVYSYELSHWLLQYFVPGKFGDI